MARKKSKGTKLALFEGRSAKSNRAIFEALARESPKNIKELQKQVSKQKAYREHTAQA